MRPLSTDLSTGLQRRMPRYVTTRSEHAVSAHVTVIYPIFDHEAIEERYATAQSKLLLRRAAPGAHWLFYDEDEELDGVVRDADTSRCLVVTDPLLVVSAELVTLLTSALDAADVHASVPMTNESGQPLHVMAPSEGYLTLRQFADQAALMASAPSQPEVVEWRGDPGIYLATTSFLAKQSTRADRALDGSRVAIARNAYVHRWSRLRGQSREDLLERTPVTAKSFLEFGCAEGLLGEAIKKRQRCRYVGIELDRRAAALAKRRLDDVYIGDVRQIVPILNEQFDVIIGGDILEHLDDPWRFLEQLRRLTTPGGRLLLSIPNVANWAIIADLLRGRFDYSYFGIACAGHVRFFTRATIRDALEISGWSIEAIDPQPPIVTSEFADLEQRLINSGLPWSRDEIVSPGYYVTARNDLR
jgi:SAM-dependent methyltransferase